MAGEAGAIQDGHQGQLASPSQKTSCQRLEGRGRRPEPGRSQGGPGPLCSDPAFGDPGRHAEEAGEEANEELQQPLLLRQ